MTFPAEHKSNSSTVHSGYKNHLFLRQAVDRDIFSGTIFFPIQPMLSFDEFKKVATGYSINVKIVCALSLAISIIASWV